MRKDEASKQLIGDLQGMNLNQNPGMIMMEGNRKGRGDTKQNPMQGTIEKRRTETGIG